MYVYCISYMSFIETPHLECQKHYKIILLNILNTEFSLLRYNSFLLFATQSDNVSVVIK